jgi:hypothetical protein
MQNLTVTIPHKLTRAEVKRRIQEESENLRRQHGGLLGPIQQTWDGDRMDFSLCPMAQPISGHLVVEDHAVHLEVALPWMLALLAGGVKQQVEQQGRRLLAGPGPK